MPYALLVTLIIVSTYSKAPNAFALDGRVGSTSEGQAQISLTIPERLEVQAKLDSPYKRKAADRFEVRSNLGEGNLKYSIKRVVFVTKDRKMPGNEGQASSHSPAFITEVFVVLPE